MLKKTRDPLWNEEFEFTLEEPPLKESIRVEVMSKGTGFHFRSKVKIVCLDHDSNLNRFKVWFWLAHFNSYIVV